LQLFGIGEGSVLNCPWLDKFSSPGKYIAMDAVIHLDQQLYDRAQQLAQAAGQTVDAFVAQTLKASLEEQSPPPEEKKYSFPRDYGSGLLPGVDISNSAQLLDVMEEGLDVSKRH
jgi:hypothetical protein